MVIKKTDREKQQKRNGLIAFNKNKSGNKQQ